MRPIRFFIAIPTLSMTVCQHVRFSQGKYQRRAGEQEGTEQEETVDRGITDPSVSQVTEGVKREVRLCH